MGAMRYKPSDKVRIKSLDWYNKNKDKNGNIVFSSKVPHFALCVNVRTVFTKDMVKYCGKVVTIESVWTVNYSIVEGTHRDYFTDEMIEGLAEEDVDLIPKFGEFSNNEPLDIPTMTTDFIKEHGLPCPEGYIFKDENGNVINATKIVLEKKEYPKTYEECYKIMGVKLSDCYIQGYKSPLLEDLQELLICRDAYWKIAGEEMGLGKPWKPDWTYNGATKYCIGVSENEIQSFNSGVAQYIFAFPTEEMRDAFKENFDEDLEFCKELL